MASRGKRVATRKKVSVKPVPLLLTFAATAAVIAWGYLVRAAIDFGVQARAGEAGGWVFLGLACLGAVACLFFGLMMVARLLRELGITSPPTPVEEPAPHGGASSPPKPIGGRRAAR